MGPARRPRTAKAAARKPLAQFPKLERDIYFCERWLIHFDAERAYRECGYSKTKGIGTRALSKLAQFAEYLRPIREAKAKIMAERLAVTTESVLAGMEAKVLFDPTDYVERSAAPLTRTVKVKRKDGSVDEREEIVVWNGAPVYAERWKPYTDLTAEQKARVEITSAAGERIQYRLPNIREQHMYLSSLGRQLGMFTEKLIVERHEHTHRHAHLTFEGVPSERIEAAKRVLLPLAGAEFAKSLGYTQADVDEALAGVVMPAKATA